jgi:hypothetical protein
MTEVPKTRIASSLQLLMLMLVPLMEGMSADASSKALAVHTPLIQPAQICASRPISRQEILKSIQGKLEQMGISGFGELSADDLTIQSSVPALLADAGLQVKRIRFDAFRGAIVFELWAMQEPQFLPFEVTLRDRPELIAKLSHELGESGGNVQTESPSLKQGARIVHTRPPVLAKPGTPATLIMLGQNVRITMAVVPLQPGAKGQSILVRDLSTERVITAEVVDQNLLQVQF